VGTLRFVASDRPSLHERLAAWWWDLSLRWKGFIVVALPSVVVIPLVIVVLLLTSSGDRSTDVVVAFAIGAGFAAILGLVGVAMLARDLVQRIRTVSEVAARVIDGSTEIDVEEPADDELGRLIKELRRAGELLILHNIELQRSRDADRAIVEREQSIREVIRRIHEAMGQEEVLAATVRELGVATDADWAFIISVDDGVMGTVIAEWTTSDVPGLGVGHPMPRDEQRDANFALLMAQRHAIAIHDVEGSGLLPQTRQLLGELHVGSLMVVPVIGEDAPLAALVLVTSGRARPWPPDAERWAEIVAANVATALTHARLYERERQMVERLRELDQAKSDFVASVSHELRTPLTSIRGYIEMLREGDAGEIDPEQARMLEIVQRNADRLLALIEDLLTVSRIESGAFRVTRAPFQLDAIVRTTVEELRPQAEARGVALAATIEGEIPVVLGDASQLERVLLNLLSNAIKFTTNGGSVAVRLRRCGDYLVLEVEDDGIGIPESDQEHLFSRFFRSTVATERAIQGTGLGLVIVKSVIEQHGGEISVRSEQDVGTTFTIRLPVVGAVTNVA
jgi:signal transduction histidine kinase